MLLSSMKPTFSVPATRGRMGKTEYYTATLPFGAVTKLFKFDPDEMAGLTPEYRSQRALKTKRIPEISAYILDHDDYIFSAITVSVGSDEAEFTEVQKGSNIGVLVLPLEAEYVINDGQHRVAGISEALRSDSSLATDTISVVVLPDGGLERSQQIFSDLNRTVHKTSRSLDILYDHRLPINRITVACTEGVDLFRRRIDKERVSLSIRSPKFATLSGLQQANSQLLGTLPEKTNKKRVDELAVETILYWNRLTDLVKPWAAIRDGDIKPQEARQEYISSYALALWALGAVGKAAIASKGGSSRWADALEGLADIDWLKTNPDWQGICMAEREVVTRMPTRRATAEYLKWKTGLTDKRPNTVISDQRRQQAPKPGAPSEHPCLVTGVSGNRLNISSITGNDVPGIDYCGQVADTKIAAGPMRWWVCSKHAQIHAELKASG